MIIEKDRRLKTEHPPTMLEAEALIREIEKIMEDAGSEGDVFFVGGSTIIRIHRVLCEMRMHMLDRDEK